MSNGINLTPNHGSSNIPPLDLSESENENSSPPELSHIGVDITVSTRPHPGPQNLTDEDLPESLADQPISPRRQSDKHRPNYKKPRHNQSQDQSSDGYHQDEFNEHRQRQRALNLLADANGQQTGSEPSDARASDGDIVVPSLKQLGALQDRIDAESGKAGPDKMSGAMATLRVVMDTNGVEHRGARLDALTRLFEKVNRGEWFVEPMDYSSYFAGAGVTDETRKEVIRVITDLAVHRAEMPRRLREVQRLLASYTALAKSGKLPKRELPLPGEYQFFVDRVKLASTVDKSKSACRCLHEILESAPTEHRTSKLRFLTLQHAFELVADENQWSHVPPDGSGYLDSLELSPTATRCVKQILDELARNRQSLQRQLGSLEELYLTSMVKNTPVGEEMVRVGLECLRHLVEPTNGSDIERSFTILQGMTAFVFSKEELRADDCRSFLANQGLAEAAQQEVIAIFSVLAKHKDVIRDGLWSLGYRYLAELTSAIPPGDDQIDTAMTALRLSLGWHHADILEQSRLYSALLDASAWRSHRAQLVNAFRRMSPRPAGADCALAVLDSLAARRDTIRRRINAIITELGTRRLPSPLSVQGWRLPGEYCYLVSKVQDASVEEKVALAQQAYADCVGSHPLALSKTQLNTLSLLLGNLLSEEQWATAPQDGGSILSGLGLSHMQRIAIKQIFDCLAEHRSALAAEIDGLMQASANAADTPPSPLLDLSTTALDEDALSRASPSNNNTWLDNAWQAAADEILASNDPPQERATAADSPLPAPSNPPLIRPNENEQPDADAMNNSIALEALWGTTDEDSDSFSVNDSSQERVEVPYEMRKLRDKTLLEIKTQSADGFPDVSGLIHLVATPDPDEFERRLEILIGIFKLLGEPDGRTAFRDEGKRMLEEVNLGRDLCDCLLDAFEAFAASNSDEKIEFYGRHCMGHLVSTALITRPRYADRVKLGLTWLRKILGANKIATLQMLELLKRVRRENRTAAEIQTLFTDQLDSEVDAYAAATIYHSLAGDREPFHWETECMPLVFLSQALASSDIADDAQATYTGLLRQEYSQLSAELTRLPAESMSTVNAIQLVSRRAIEERQMAVSFFYNRAVFVLNAMVEGGFSFPSPDEPTESSGFLYGVPLSLDVRRFAYSLHLHLRSGVHDERLLDITRDYGLACKSEIKSDEIRDACRKKKFLPLPGEYAFHRNAVASCNTATRVDRAMAACYLAVARKPASYRGLLRLISTLDDTPRPLYTLSDVSLHFAHTDDVSKEDMAFVQDILNGLLQERGLFGSTLSEIASVSHERVQWFDSMYREEAWPQQFHVMPGTYAHLNFSMQYPPVGSNKTIEAVRAILSFCSRQEDPMLMQRLVAFLSNKLKETRWSNHEETLPSEVIALNVPGRYALEAAVDRLLYISRLQAIGIVDSLAQLEAVRVNAGKPDMIPGTSEFAIEAVRHADDGHQKVCTAIRSLALALQVDSDSEERVIAGLRRMCLDLLNGVQYEKKAYAQHKYFDSALLLDYRDLLEQEVYLSLAEGGRKHIIELNRVVQGLDGLKEAGKKHELLAALLGDNSYGKSYFKLEMARAPRGERAEIAMQNLRSIVWSSEPGLVARRVEAVQAIYESIRHSIGGRDEISDTAVQLLDGLGLTHSARNLILAVLRHAVDAQVDLQASILSLSDDLRVDTVTRSDLNDEVVDSAMDSLCWWVGNDPKMREALQGWFRSIHKSGKNWNRFSGFEKDCRRLSIAAGKVRRIKAVLEHLAAHKESLSPHLEAVFAEACRPEFTSQNESAQKAYYTISECERMQRLVEEAPSANVMIATALHSCESLLRSQEVAATAGLRWGLSLKKPLASSLERLVQCVLDEEAWDAVPPDCSGFLSQEIPDRTRRSIYAILNELASKRELIAHDGITAADWEAQELGRRHYDPSNSSLSLVERYKRLSNVQVLFDRYEDLNRYRAFAPYAYQRSLCENLKIGIESCLQGNDCAGADRLHRELSQKVSLLAILESVCDAKDDLDACRPLVGNTDLFLQCEQEFGRIDRFVRSGRHADASRACGQLSGWIRGLTRHSGVVFTLQELRDEHVRLGRRPGMRASDRQGYDYRTSLIDRLEQAVFANNVTDIRATMIVLQDQINWETKHHSRWAEFDKLRLGHEALGTDAGAAERAEDLLALEELLKSVDVWQGDAADTLDGPQQRFRSLSEKIAAAIEAQRPDSLGSRRDELLQSYRGLPGQPQRLNLPRINAYERPIPAANRLAIDAARVIFDLDLEDRTVEVAQYATLPAISAMRNWLTVAGVRSHQDQFINDRLGLLLAQDGELLCRLNAIEAPQPDNPLCDVIRQTLNLSPTEPITARHARAAVLSAFLAELRQQDVGSCFGTAIAMNIHDDQPHRFLDNLREMVETGSLSTQKKRRGDPQHRVRKAVRTDTSEGCFDDIVRVSLKSDDPLQDIHPKFLSWLKHNPGKAFRFRKVLAADSDIQTAEVLSRGALEVLWANKSLQQGMDQKVKTKELVEEFVIKEVLFASMADMPGATVTDIRNYQRLKECEAEIDRLEEDLRSIGIRNDSEQIDSNAIVCKRQCKKDAEHKRGDLILRLGGQSSNRYQMLAKSWADYELRCTHAWKRLISEGDNLLLRAFEYTVTSFAEDNASHHSGALYAGDSAATSLLQDPPANISINIIKALKDSGFDPRDLSPGVADRLKKIYGDSRAGASELLYRLDISLSQHVEKNLRVVYDAAVQADEFRIYKINSRKQMLALAELELFRKDGRPAVDQLKELVDAYKLNIDVSTIRESNTQTIEAVRNLISTRYKDAAKTIEEWVGYINGESTMICDGQTFEEMEAGGKEILAYLNERYSLGMRESELEVNPNNIQLFTDMLRDRAEKYRRRPLATAEGTGEARTLEPGGFRLINTRGFVAPWKWHSIDSDIDYAQLVEGMTRAAFEQVTAYVSNPRVADDLKEIEELILNEVRSRLQENAPGKALVGSAELTRNTTRTMWPSKWDWPVGHSSRRILRAFYDDKKVGDADNSIVETVGSNKEKPLDATPIVKLISKAASKPRVKPDGDRSNLVNAIATMPGHAFRIIVPYQQRSEQSQEFVRQLTENPNLSPVERAERAKLSEAGDEGLVVFGDSNWELSGSRVLFALRYDPKSKEYRVCQLGAEQNGADATVYKRVAGNWGIYQHPAGVEIR